MTLFSANLGMLDLEMVMEISVQESPFTSKEDGKGKVFAQGPQILRGSADSVSSSEI